MLQLNTLTKIKKKKNKTIFIQIKKKKNKKKLQILEMDAISKLELLKSLVQLYLPLQK